MIARSGLIDAARGTVPRRRRAASSPARATSVPKSTGVAAQPEASAEPAGGAFAPQRLMGS